MNSLTGYNWSDSEGLNSEIIFWIFKKAFSLVATMNLSAAAKKAGIEVWSLGDKYISPREWRRMHRK